MHTKLLFQKFKDGIARLSSVYGERYYPEERNAQLYHIVKGLDEISFYDMVSEMIATYRSAPIGKEFAEQTKRAEQLRQMRARQKAGDGGLISVLESAYKPAEFANSTVRERIVLRQQLVKDLCSGKLTKKQFFEGCDFVDNQMPGGVEKIKTDHVRFLRSLGVEDPESLRRLFPSGNSSK